MTCGTEDALSDLGFGRVFAELILTDAISCESTRPDIQAISSDALRILKETDGAGV